MIKDTIEKQLQRYFHHEDIKPINILKQVLEGLFNKFQCKKRILVVPAGIFAQELSSILIKNGYNIVAFLDNYKESSESIVVFKPEYINNLEFDALLIATPSISAQISLRDQILGIIPERSEDIYILVDMLEADVNNLADYIANKIKATMNGFNTGKKICVVSPYMSHSYLKRLYYLKYAGYHVTLIIENEFLNSSISIFDYDKRGFFDICYVSQLYPVIMPKVLEKVDFDLVHSIISTESTIPIAQAVNTLTKPFVTEYWDFKELIFDNKEDYYFYYMDERDFVRESKSWEILFTKSNGIILKDSPEIMKVLSNKYNSKPYDWIQFMPYASLEFAEMNKKVKRFSELDGKVHIVFAGCVINTPKASAYHHHRTLLDIAEALNNQGIWFTIINALDKGNGGYQEYVKLSNDLSFFEYHPAIPIENLVNEISKYDLGWYAYDFTYAKESKFFVGTTFGSKIFSYMEAGLPILVSREIDYACKWVEEKGIGKSILFSEINNLSDDISRLNIEEMRRNIKRLLPELSMENQIERMVKFYDKILIQ